MPWSIILTLFALGVLMGIRSGQQDAAKSSTKK